MSESKPPCHYATASTANLNKHNNDTRIVEFIHDLKVAIQNGEFHQQMDEQQQSQSPNENEKLIAEQSAQSITMISSLINVNNLSNQTFNYIISWLKQQQHQIEENKDQAKSDTDLKCIEQPEESDIRSLKSQMRLIESEKEKMFAKLKDLQEENLDLKTKLINLKNMQYTYANTGCQSMLSNCGSGAAFTSSPGPIDKDYEIERLKRIIDELVKSNEEKDKRCDELAKQVIRFKRIQEIVLSAQTSVNPHTNHVNGKNRDLDFDTNSDSNSLPSINGDDLQQGIIPSKLPAKSSQQQQQQQQVSASTCNTKPTAIIGSNINQVCSLISSCSLSSSLSSSSNASSTSSSSSAIAQTNGTHLTAPLATISELNNSVSNDNTHHSGRMSQSMDHYNTLPTKPHLIDNTEIVSKTKPSHSLNSSSSTVMNDETARTAAEPPVKSAHFSQNLEVFKMRKLNKKGGSISSLNTDTATTAAVAAKKTNLKSEKNDHKYFSTSSVHHHHHDSQSPPTPAASKKQPTASQKSSPVHSSSNKSIRNFFGKLIRTSLVNINESSFNLNANLIGLKDANKNNKLKLENGTEEAANVSQTKAPNGTSSFRRGGTRATANARLQNNAFSVSNNCLLNNKQNYMGNNNLDTLTFAKWPSEQVYEWLNRNGFEAYFPYNADGHYVNKWIKNGLQLLQASPHDYEKELGIKNPMHRKRLSLLLQSMYNTANLTLSEINFTNYIDQLWVTKWLDDIGLPQYKDVFNESKIDGIMLNNLTNEDLQTMNIQSELHYLSIKRAIHVLRLNEFDPQCLRRRPSGDDLLDKSEVVLWTNHRVMEWLRSIDLSEYAPNLRGSGVHGSLMVFEARFNSTVLADILAIPASKTLLRRHLNTLFVDLIGPQMYQAKRDAESQPSSQPLNASTKIKTSKRGVGLFGSHKRTKSQDRDFLSAPILMYGEEHRGTATTVRHHPKGGSSPQSNMQPINAMIASFCEETSMREHSFLDADMTSGPRSKSKLVSN